MLGILGMLGVIGILAMLGILGMLRDGEGKEEDDQCLSQADWIWR